jgi:hypothetical protein
MPWANYYASKRFSPDADGEPSVRPRQPRQAPTPSPARKPRSTLDPRGTGTNGLLRARAVKNKRSDLGSRKKTLDPRANGWLI